MKKRILTSLFVGFIAVTAFAQVLDESFETWLPEGWEVNEHNGKSWVQSEVNCDGNNGPGKAYDGEYAALYKMSGGPLGAYDLTSDIFDLTGFKNPQLSFAWFYNGSAAELSSLEILAGYDKEGMIEYESVSVFPTNVAMKDWTVANQVLNRNVKKVMFRINKVSGASFRDLYIDKVEIKEGPEVAAPVKFAYEYISGEDGKVRLTWKAINDENCWNLKISENEIDPNTESAFVEKNNLTVSEYLAENLTVGARYYAYVQTVSGEKTSEWVVIDFILDAAPLAVPFSVDFEKDNGGFAYIQDGQTNKWYWGAAARVEEGGKSLFVSQDGESFSYTIENSCCSFAYRMVQFPEEMEYGALLTFDFRGIGFKPNHVMEIYAIEDLSVYPVAGEYVKTQAGKVTKLGDQYFGCADWTKQTVEIPASFAGKTIRLVFSWRNNNYQQPGETSAAIDNLTITSAEVNIPKNIVVTESTVNSLTFNWDVVGNETAWEVEYGNYDFEPGTGTVVKVTERPPFVLSGLEEAHYYGAVVRAISGNIVSDNSEVLIAATKPTERTAPYMCNFDEYNMMPADWTYYTNNAVPYILSGSDYYYHSAPNAVIMVQTTNNDNLTLISPHFSDLKERKYRIAFYAKIDVMQTLSVGVMTNPEDISTFVELKKYAGGDYVTVDNTGTAMPDMYRHILNLDSELITEEHKYIAFKCGNTYQKPSSIDDFVYELIPDFKEPENLKILDVLDTSARLTWTPQNGETKWEVAYGENNYEVEESTEGVIVEGNPVLKLSNLAKGHYYTAFVRAIDTDGNKSGWSEAYFFRTCDGGWTLPYMEAFDEMLTYGIAPLGWTVKDYTSKWGLSSKDYSSYPNCVERASDMAAVNDWLFTPPFELNKEEQYLFSFRVKSESAESEGKVTVHYGLNPLPEEMSEAIVTEDKLNDSYKLVKVRFVPFETGIYNVGINYQESSCSGLRIDDVMFQSEGLSSIDNYSAVQKSVVYPAIAHSEIFVSGSETPMSVSVFNLDGVMVWNDSAYVAGTPISVEGLPAGTYIVYVVMVEGAYCQKIVVLE